MTDGEVASAQSSGLVKPAPPLPPSPPRFSSGRTAGCGGRSSGRGGRPARGGARARVCPRLPADGLTLSRAAGPFEAGRCRLNLPSAKEE